MLRRSVIAIVIMLLLMGASMLHPRVRRQVRALVRPDPTPQLTPLPVIEPGALPQAPAAALPSPTPTVRPSATPARVAAPVTSSPAQAPSATPQPSPTLPPSPTPTSTPVVVNGRAYDAYIPAAVKQRQEYKYSCEFDAAWVILRTYGIYVSVDELIAIVGVDNSIEPYIEKTADGFIIHGGDISTSVSGNYAKNYLARSTGMAMREAFEHFGLPVTPVHDRAGVEQALRSGQLVWIKTTVDFNVWRPATWRMQDGRTVKTVLGNDHAVVVMGFNDQGVVIRDVLGPTSSNWQRPYEYAVDWATFLAAWEAQSYDGLAVAPPGSTR